MIDKRSAIQERVDEVRILGWTSLSTECTWKVSTSKDLDITTTPLGAYELEDLAGGPISKDQIQLCGEVREFWKKK